MKTKFKKGDKVEVVNNGRQYTTHSRAAKDLKATKFHFLGIIKDGSICKVVSTGMINGNVPSCCIEFKDRHYLIANEGLKLVTQSSSHPLVITKQTKVRAGKKYYTWQFSKNKRVSNHQYNQPGTRNKQLNQFIEDIQNGNFEIK